MYIEARPAIESAVLSAASGLALSTSYAQRSGTARNVWQLATVNSPPAPARVGNEQKI